MKTTNKNQLKHLNRIILISIISIIFQNVVVAQNTDKPKHSNTNLYIDMGMHFAGQVSINLEKQIYSGEKITWYGRAGIGGAGVAFGETGAGVLGAITMLTGKGKNHFEMNGGAILCKNQWTSFVLPIIDLGYRYQKPEGGFIFRAKAGFLGIGIGLGVAF